jgi:hypothetical protein
MQSNLLIDYENSAQCRAFFYKLASTPFGLPVDLTQGESVRILIENILSTSIIRISWQSHLPF